MGLGGVGGEGSRLRMFRHSWNIKLTSITVRIENTKEIIIMSYKQLQLLIIFAPIRKSVNQ